MITLYLVRHGEVHNPNHVVYANLPGFDLSSTGVLQAHSAATHLSGAALDAVVSSPLRRAIHTATPIAHKNGLAVTVDRRLTETGMYPAWTGRRWDEVEADYPSQLGGYLTDASRLDDVDETVDSIAKRVRDVVHDALIAGSRRFAVVSHQDPIAAARLALLGSPLSDLRTDPAPHGSCIELQSPDGVTWLESRSWTPDDQQGIPER